MSVDKPRLEVRDVSAWRAWLDVHEDSSDGVWLVLAKKGTTNPTSLTYAEALDEAICSGWIDGQLKRLDEKTHLQSFTPRRARSMWSARNVGYVARLTAEGRMRPRGIQEVERAQADGRWDNAYEGSAKIEVPPELQTALNESPDAAAMFAVLTSQNRYAILHRLKNMKTEAAKSRNIVKFVAMLERGETLYPQKRRPER
jgi:uncharacterized protein YdeI (YjbR/CyaY-like superfamily)